MLREEGKGEVENGGNDLILPTSSFLTCGKIHIELVLLIGAYISNLYNLYFRLNLRFVGLFLLLVIVILLAVTSFVMNFYQTIFAANGY